MYVRKVTNRLTVHHVQTLPIVAEGCEVTREEQQCREEPQILLPLQRVWGEVGDKVGEGVNMWNQER